MAWHLRVSDMPGRPFAVVDGNGEVAGCHATREAASIQMSTLNVHENVADAPSKEPITGPTGTVVDGRLAPRREPTPRREEPVAYRPSKTIAW